MKNKRYRIVLDSTSEVGIPCVHVEVRTRTKSWANGPIITEIKNFSVLTTKAKRAIVNKAKAFKGLEGLLEAVEEGGARKVDPIHVKMVIAGCKTNRPYLYVSDSGEFLSEREIVTYAKDGEG